MSDPLAIVANFCKTVSSWRNIWDLVIECFGLGVEEESMVLNSLRIFTYCSHHSSEMSVCLHCIIIPITHLCLDFWFKFRGFFILFFFLCFKTCVMRFLNVFSEMRHYAFRCLSILSDFLLKFGEAVEMSHHSAKSLSPCLNFIHLRMH